MLKPSPKAVLCGLFLATPMLGHAECPAIGVPITVAQTGEVNVTMKPLENPEAIYASRLYLQGHPTYDSAQPIFESVPVSPGLSTPPETTISLGSFKAGTELVFKLVSQNPSTFKEFTFYSGDQTRNEDAKPHAALSLSGSGDLTVRFEDTPGNGECPNGTGAFTDFTFAVSNVKSVLSPDRFLSFKAKPTPITKNTLSLSDALGNVTVTISKRASLANPAKIGETEIVSPDPSLVGYSVSKPKNRKATFNVTNELGNWTVSTKKLDRILIPSSADRNSVPSAPDLSVQGVIDAYTCFTTKAKGTKNLNSTKQLQEELNGARSYKVTTPSHFCAPAGSNGASAERPETFLMCYVVKPSGKSATVNIANSVEGASSAKVLKAEEYCVPSTATKQ